MTKLAPYILLAGIHWMVLSGSVRISKMVYQPYGPLMCRELCDESKESFTYDEEDLSCRQIQTTTIGVVGNRSREDATSRLKDKNTINSSTSIAVRSRHKNRKVVYKGQSRIQSPSPSSLNHKQQMTTEALYSVGLIDGPMKMLHQACEKGNLTLVKLILSKKLADINSFIPNKGTPVMSAARNGQVQVFKFLLSHECALYALGLSGDNVLHIACRTGSLAMVKELVKRKYDINSRGHNGVTPVLIAARKGVKDIVKFLLYKHCDMRATDNSGNNILHAACIGGHIDMVKYVIWLTFVRIHKRNKLGFTPLQLAEDLGFEKVVKFLKSKG